MKSDLFRSLLMGQTANEQLYNNLNAMINKTLVKLRVPRNPSNKEEEEEPHSKEATNEASVSFFFTKIFVDSKVESRIRYAAEEDSPCLALST